MLVGYMRVSKADGSQTSPCRADPRRRPSDTTEPST
ncbi:MAG: hypothetical protein JWQ07_5672 [Ramlibacter sp.]|nr:hypothetical protein [Ramlibacter sp.]